MKADDRLSVNDKPVHASYCHATITHANITGEVVTGGA